MTRYFDYGLMAGVLLMLAANAMHWLLTSHRDATPARTSAVVVQMLVGIAGSIWLVRSRRRASPPTSPGR